MRIVTDDIHETDHTWKTMSVLQTEKATDAFMDGGIG